MGNGVNRLPANERTLQAAALPTERSRTVGWWSPRAINNRGQIVGQALYGAIIWDRGAIAELPMGMGIDAESINDNGLCVGEYDDGEYPHEGWGFIWDGNEIIPLSKGLGARGSWAVDINIHGQIVGCLTDHRKNEYAVLWDHGTLIELPSLPGGFISVAAAINDAGQIAGDCGHDAVCWQEGEVFQLSMLPGSVCSEVSDINAVGQIVGLSMNATGDRRAVLWMDGMAIPLDPLPGHTQSEAMAINDHGQVIGTSAAKLKNCESRAVLWQDATVSELPRSPRLGGVGATYAVDINNQGQIAGYSDIGATLWQDGEVIDLAEQPADYR